MWDLQPPRHISTLPKATELLRCRRLTRWAHLQTHALQQIRTWKFSSDAPPQWRRPNPGLAWADSRIMLPFKKIVRIPQQDIVWSEMVIMYVHPTRALIGVKATKTLCKNFSSSLFKISDRVVLQDELFGRDIPARNLSRGLPFQLDQPSS